MHTNYGIILFENEKFDEAIVHFEEALRIYPIYSTARNYLGKTFLKQGNLDEAVKCFNDLLLIRPDLPDVYANLGLAYSKLGKDNLAIINLTKSIELDPQYINSFNNLAWILATTEDAKLQNPLKAVEFAEKTCKLTEYNRADFLDTLAVAYAAAGNFPKAIEIAEKAIKLAEAAGENDLAEEIRERLDLYKSGQPYRRE